MRFIGRILVVVAISLFVFSLEAEPEQNTSAAKSGEPESIVIADFENDDVGAFPSDWQWRGWGEVREKPYWVLEENGNRFLRAEDTGQNVVLIKRLRWDIKKYPFMSWRWRIRAVPEGADERYEEWVDSAAGIYLTYRKKLGLVPQSIKFVWSAGLPTGTSFRRKGIGMPWTVIVGSGTDSLNRWHTFVFNVVESYQKTFGGDPGDRPLGIGILSDANNTRSRAFADYDDIIVSTHATSTQRIDRVISVQQDAEALLDKLKNRR